MLLYRLSYKQTLLICSRCFKYLVTICPQFEENLKFQILTSNIILVTLIRKLLVFNHRVSSSIIDPGLSSINEYFYLPLTLLLKCIRCPSQPHLS